MIPVTHAEHAPDVDSELDRPELEDYTSYEDDDALVICDRNNPRAWIRSTNRVSLRQ